MSNASDDELTRAKLSTVAVTSESSQTGQPAPVGHAHRLEHRMDCPVSAGRVTLLTAALTRHGLLTLVVSLFVFRVLTNVPSVPDPSHWAAAPGNWTLAALALLTAFGFCAARGGQQLFGRVLPE